MTNETKRFLADFRIESDLVVGEGLDKLDFSHPQGLYEVTLRPVGKDSRDAETLSAQLVLPAADIDAAAESAEPLLRSFLHLLAFVTMTKFKITRTVMVMDWTPGLSNRDVWVYTGRQREPPVPNLGPDLLDTVAALQSIGVTPLIKQSLRWFSNGVAADLMEDQFQYFWFVIEGIAVTEKSRDKVPDKCQLCGGGLRCDACGELSEHRPFDSQAIRALFESLRVHADLIRDLFKIRNMLLHGEPREVIEPEIQKRVSDFSFDKGVDLLGRIAWDAILRSFGKVGEARRLVFTQASTFVTWHMNVVARMIVSVSGDPAAPKYEDVELPNLTVTMVGPDDKSETRRPRAKSIPKGHPDATPAPVSSTADPYK